MNTQTLTPSATINGVDVEAIREMIDTVTHQPAKGMTRWGVNTVWRGGTRSDTRITSYEIGGRRIDKAFTVQIDEPLELGGTNAFPNPQETLMAALNACMMVGYVAVSSLMGIELTELEIACDGEIDLRGFLGIDDSVTPGYEAIHYTVRIAGNASPEQFQKVHEIVMATSPNRWNIANPIRLSADLVVN